MLAIIASSVACGSTASTPDAAVQDAAVSDATRSDAAIADAAIADASAADAAMTDAAMTDAAVIDAMPPDASSPDAASSTNDLTAFSFGHAQNPGITADIPATTIGASRITVAVPAGTDVSALIATFTTNGMQVTVGGVVQASGVTANDFRAPVVYRVTAANGATKDYTVTLTSFATRADATCAATPHGVAIGDLNGDGKPDLACANLAYSGQAAYTVTVRVNTTAAGAAPSFGRRVDLTTGTSPWDLAIGDVTGDGKPDIITADSSSGQVSVLVNTSAVGAATPTFAAHKEFAAGSYPTVVRIADLDGDGRGDLVVITGGNVGILRNQTPAGGAPSFAAPIMLTTDSASEGIAIGDLNGDGKPDVAVADGAVASIFLNQTATGSTTIAFASKVDVSVSSSQFSLSVAIGDLDRDGKNDLVVGSQFQLFALRNKTAVGGTTPTFAAAVGFDAGQSPLAVALADLDGDGSLDVALALGAPDGTFANASVLFNRTPIGSTTPDLGARIMMPVGLVAQAIATGDLDGDGRVDLAITNVGSGDLTVLANTTTSNAPTRQFAPHYDISEPNGQEDLAVGDLDGDGRPDLAVSNSYQNSVLVFRDTTPDGATTASLAAPVAFSTTDGPFGVAIGDIDGDGRPDLVAAELTTSNVAVLVNTTPAGATAPTFATGVDFPTGGMPYRVALGDFNHDGKLDVATANSVASGPTTLSILLNTTAAGQPPSFATSVILNVPTAVYDEIVVVADFNADGRPDVAMTAVDSVAVFLNTTPNGGATASFSPVAVVTTGFEPRALTIADIDGDGRPDIVTGNYGEQVSGGSVSVLLDRTATGASAPTFAAQFDAPTGVGPLGLAAGDLDGDGRTDLVTGDADQYSTSVLFNRSGATPALLYPFAVLLGTDSPYHAAVADMNRDGKPDIVLAGRIFVSVVLAR